MKTVCFFGIFDPNYARTRVLRRAFEENGVSIIECRVDPREGRGVRKFILLFRKAWKLRKKCDRILVCFPGQSIVWIAKIIFQRDIIFDAFLSLYDSNVYDRKLYGRWHPRAWYDWFLDWHSARIGDKVLLDTYEHINYFTKTFHIRKEKFIRVPISADETLFFPRESSKADNFIVHFHGMFIPLQGVEYIVDAAEELKEENITFVIVGSGQEFKKISEKVKSLNVSNFHMVGKVDLTEVPSYIAKSDVCLGIFGQTDKTLRVIPNKVYEYAAMGKPVITAESPAINEVFTHGKDMVLCKTANGHALAEAIMYLYTHPDIASSIGLAARQTFEDKLNAKSIGTELLKKI